MNAESPAEGSEVILVLTSGARDAALTQGLLARAAVASTVCKDVESLCTMMHAHGGAIVDEEIFTRASVAHVSAALARQPAWSDFPFVLFRSRAAVIDDPRDHPLGNVTIVDRPVRVRTMIAAVRAALRSRRRQYAARRAIESRDQFLAMLGHELRNPLGAILLGSELLGRTKDDAGRDKQRAVIERQARHLSRLVDDLLDVARISYGKVVLHTAPVDLVDLVRACTQAIEPAARAAKLTLTFSAHGGPFTVVGDRLRLEQIFNNLLTNSVKYTPAGGSVAVSVERSDGYAVVTVVDTGIGIASNMLPRIFDVFTQADRTLDRAKGGLGLGLTVVRSLVRLHGGDVEASSDGLGKGTELRVRLPLTTASAQANAPTVAHVVPPDARRVVVVEDNEDVRALLEQLLLAEGHTVWTADDGPSGHALIADKRPDVAFVDIGLPGFDGYELARRVRADGVQSTLVAVTGYGQPEDRRRALAAGFDQHLTKPIGHEMLEAAIDRGKGG